MSEAAIYAYANAISQRIVENYLVDFETANNAVKKSPIVSLIKKHNDFALHYSMDAWAEDIWSSYIKH